MGIKLEVNFEGNDINLVAAEVFDALCEFESMLSMVERCGEVPVSTSGALRSLLKVQKAVLDRYKGLTAVAARSAKMHAELEEMLPLRASAS